LDADRSTINLHHVVEELERTKGGQPLLRHALESTASTFAKVRILRNAVFAHRTNKKSYGDVFKRAAITPDQLQDLIVTCIKIANELRVGVGLEGQAPTSLPADRYERMLKQLANKA
jgi:fructose-1-phosphate kinase PfkB-like protein